jgi:uncharacterized protein YqjF (DUF2071 family)
MDRAAPARGLRVSLAVDGFDRGIFERTAHRPWPMPGGPWIMTQTWNDLLFAHWPVDAERVRALIPAGFEVELFNGSAWLGIVPFHMTNVAPRFVPALPWVSAFPELNVRTYVAAGGKPGVFFFSLDAGNPLAVAAARTLLNLPYYSAAMTVDATGDTIAYTSRRQSEPAGRLRLGYGARAEFAARYRGQGDRSPSRRGTLEHFLTERYCLYAVDHGSHAYRLEIHHPEWALESAEADITVNTMADAAGVRLPSMAPLLHFSKRQDAVCWAPERL